MCVFGGPIYALSSWDQKSPQEDQSVCTPESLPPRKMTRSTDFLPQTSLPHTEISSNSALTHMITVTRVVREKSTNRGN